MCTSMETDTGSGIPRNTLPEYYVKNINKAEANKPLKLLTDLRIPYNKLFVNYITFFTQKFEIMIDIL